MMNKILKYALLLLLSTGVFISILAAMDIYADGRLTPTHGQK